MKNLVKPLVLITVISATFFLSCTNDDDTPIPTSIYTWTFEGTPDTSSLFFASLHDEGTAGESKIIAGKGAIQNYMDKVWISLPSLDPGSYALGPGTVDSLIYFDDFETLTAISGAVTISENKNNHINGDFSATLVNAVGTNKSIFGSFTYVEIYP